MVEETGRAFVYLSSPSGKQAGMTKVGGVVSSREDGWRGASLLLCYEDPSPSARPVAAAGNQVGYVCVGAVPDTLFQPIACTWYANTSVSNHACAPAGPPGGIPAQYLS